jgi:hypothetical protein
MSESLLESAVTGGAISLEVRWTADAQLSHSVKTSDVLFIPNRSATPLRPPTTQLLASSARVI